jgi:hypothetical protein
MLTVAEYLAKANELEAVAENCAPGAGQDAYLEMARQWRGLAAKATTMDAISLGPPTITD